MMGADAYELIGLRGSPYTMKLLALLRYRRIRHVWTQLLPELSDRSFSVRPLLLPILIDSSGREHIDSTPLAHALEDWFPSGRSALPDDPAMLFLCHLVEDFADEWLTKAMFHYRWSYPEDVAYCSNWVASDIAPLATAAERASIAASIARRQIDRLEVVGCTGSNVEVIEATFFQLLDILGMQLASRPYLFGTRPSLADFALFGQLIQLATDPVPAKLMRTRAPTVFDWTRRMDDLSGWPDGDWQVDAITSDAVVELVELIGTIYLRYLRANAAAVAAGQPCFAVELGGVDFRQDSVRYQGKCFDVLRQHWRRFKATGADLGSLSSIEEYLS